uniref:Ty3 transposon capsid-like protein domain-containing protein n=1 Tax=Trichuris muris TaxID=70415 RepID=A0A5S6QNZ5_TRIMR
MDAVRKSRAVARSAFSRACRQLEAELAAEQPDPVEVQVSLSMLNQKVEALVTEEQRLMEAMLQSAAELAEIDEDAKGSEEYTRRWLRLQQAAERQLQTDRCRSASGTIVSDGSSRSRRRFRLPKLELKRFNGDIDQWLSFWISFAQIHEDDSIAPEDKFQYLIQCMDENSRARELVESFPPTAGNYAKVIESLKSRFGRTELLVEVYVRKMLSLILRNAVRAEPLKLSSLYDKLESYMRALETLGVTTESHVATILPLVESCLPGEILRAWQRTNRGQSNSLGCDALSERLKRLMEFLRREVEGEDRIALAMSTTRSAKTAVERLPTQSRTD